MKEALGIDGPTIRTASAGQVVLVPQAARRARAGGPRRELRR
jgi:hypothetical protein